MFMIMTFFITTMDMSMGVSMLMFMGMNNIAMLMLMGVNMGVFVGMLKLDCIFNQ